MEAFYNTVKDYVIAAGIEGVETGDKPKRLVRMQQTLERVISNSELAKFHHKAELFRGMINEKLARINVRKLTSSSPVITFPEDTVNLRTPCLPTRESLLFDHRNVHPDYNLWSENFGLDSRNTTCFSCVGRSTCPVFAVRTINDNLSVKRNAQGDWEFPVVEAIDSPLQGLIAEAIGFSVEDNLTDNNGHNNSEYYVPGCGDPVQHKVIEHLAGVIGDDGYVAGEDTRYELGKFELAQTLGCSSSTINQVITDRTQCLENVQGGFILKSTGCVGDSCRYFGECPIQPLIGSTSR
jgi:hypothetical protein